MMFCINLLRLGRGVERQAADAELSWGSVTLGVPAAIFRKV